MPRTGSPKNRAIRVDFEVGVEDPRQGREGFSVPARQKLRAIPDGECQQGPKVAGELRGFATPRKAAPLGRRRTSSLISAASASFRPAMSLPWARKAGSYALPTDRFPWAAKLCRCGERPRRAALASKRAECDSLGGKREAGLETVDAAGRGIDAP